MLPSSGQRHVWRLPLCELGRAGHFWQVGHPGTTVQRFEGKGLGLRQLVVGSRCGAQRKSRTRYSRCCPSRTGHVEHQLQRDWRAQGGIEPLGRQAPLGLKPRPNTSQDHAHFLIFFILFYFYDLARLCISHSARFRRESTRWRRAV